MVVGASAPLGIPDAHLGAPYDRNFRRFGGPDGASLFPAAVRQSAVDELRAASVVTEDAGQLAANFEGWSVKADLGAALARRFASRRVLQIKAVHEVDDMVPLRTPPAGAVWYLARIYVGHSYEEVVSGDESTFHAGLRAGFLAFEGGVDAWAKQNHLAFEARGRGLQPKGADAIFSDDPEELRASYQALPEEPVPIFIEYRSIPGVKPPPAKALRWADAPPLYRYRVELAAIEGTPGDCDGAGDACDFAVRFWTEDNADEAQWQNGPGNGDVWKPNFALWGAGDVEATAIARGMHVEVVDRDFMFNDGLGLCEVRFDARRLEGVATSGGTSVTTQPCGKVSLGLRVVAEPQKDAWSGQ